MIGNRRVAFVTTVVLLSVGCSYAEYVTPSIKDCAANETCSVQPTAVTAAATTTTPKNAPKTTAVGSGSPQIVRYDVSGNDSKGSTLKDVVVQVDDKTVTPLGGDKTNGSGNAATPSSSNVTVVVKPPVGKANAMATETNLTMTNATNTTSISITTTTTTEFTSVSPPKYLSENHAEVVRFVPYKYCHCDRIYGSCDINCCCDTDCTNHNLKTFTLCPDQAKSTLIKQESILFDSSLFYVVIENVPSDYFYPERDTIESETQIETSLRKRNIFTWRDEKTISRHHPLTSTLRVDSSVYNNYDLTYKSSRWMFNVVTDVNSSEIKTFGLKNSALDSLCSVEQPVEYLKTKETNCKTFVPNLTDFCNNNSSLSFKFYYGERGLFKVVQPIYNSIHKIEKIGLVTIQATAHHHCVSVNGSSYDCQVGKVGVGTSGNDHRPHYEPVYLGGVCHRTVDGVEYLVTHNGSRGVRQVDVHFYHRDVPDAGRPIYLGQSFGVRFVWATVKSAVESYERSGKPGYVTGSPVLVTKGGKDIVKLRRPKTMELPEPDGYGGCVHSTGPRQSVNFLESVNVQCRVRVRRRNIQLSKRAEDHSTPGGGVTFADICNDIQNETMAVLGDYEGVLVASLGDPDVTRWIQFVVVKPPAQQPPQSEDSCPAVTDGVHIRVLYSHVGPFDSPRATVLGVLANYTASAVTVSGGGGGDRSAVVEVPVTVTVVFVDLTRPPVRTFAEPPTYEFRLPEDFYYPFWSSGAGRVSSSVHTVRFVVGLQLLLSYIHCYGFSYSSRVLPV